MPRGIFVRTVEYKEKMSKAKKGVKRPPCSEETRQRMSESRKGKPNGAKGKHWKLSETTKIKMRKPHPGSGVYTRTDEYKKKLKEIANRPETKMRISELHKGKKRTKETRKKMSEAHQGLHWKCSEKAKENISKGNKRKSLGRHRSKETNKKHSESHKKQWQNPEFQKKMTKALNIKPNKLEQFFDKLTPEYIQYVGDFKLPISTKIGTRFPDFIVKNQNKIIELFGNYWHQGENSENKIREYKEAGYECLVFWENEIYKEPEKVLRQILEFVNFKK